MAAANAVRRPVFIGSRAKGWNELAATAGFIKLGEQPASLVGSACTSATIAEPAHIE
jgi:hypothetical protein